VAGTRRRIIMERWGAGIGYSAREHTLSLTDVMDADEVFYSSSLQTVRPVARINDRAWDQHGVCEAIFQQFLADIEWDRNSLL
jgi:branched-subunit amino acid aminotransferase/4-amino-4-deoxychorismate lyase